MQISFKFTNINNALAFLGVWCETEACPDKQYNIKIIKEKHYTVLKIYLID